MATEPSATAMEPEKSEENTTVTDESTLSAPQRVCVFKVMVLSANKVWTSELEKDTCKAAVSVRFPGQKPEDSFFISEAVLPIEEPLLEVATNPPEPAAPETTKGGKPAAKAKGKVEVVVPPHPISFDLNASSEYSRNPDFLFLQDLAADPLVVSLLWTSPSGQTTTTVGTVTVDFSNFIMSEQLYWDFEYDIKPYVEEKPVVVETKTTGSKKNAPEKAAPKAKKNVTEEAPPLLENATLKIKIQLDTPVLSEEERNGGALIEFKDFCVKPVPKEYWPSANPINAAANYSLAFKIPGFSGSWYDSMQDLSKEFKDKISIAKLNNGALTETSLVSPPQPSTGPANPPPRGSTANAPTRVSVSNAAPRGSSIKPLQVASEAIITWKTTVRRYLPKIAVQELKECIWRKQQWHGEVARYSPTDPDPSSPAARTDHLMIELNMSSLLEENVKEIKIYCPLETYSSQQELLGLQNVAVNVSNASSKGVNWQSCSSQLNMEIITSRPFQPTWTPPPRPQLSMEDVLTVRPKLPTLNNKLQIAMKDFQMFVTSGAESILSMHEKLISDNESNPWSNRAEFNDNLKKLLSNELHKTGAWKNLKEEMKGRIVRIAREKYKTLNDTMKDNCFSFYNSLYMELMDMLQDTIRTLDSKRREAFLNFSEGLETGASKKLHTTETLTQLAYEYEADGDYHSANRCYEEILSGDASASDIWFQYGLFCMRGKLREHGKAEECFTEALNLQPDSTLSMLALACLMWHRLLYEQAAAILYKITEMNSKEEVIAWILLGQIHLSRGGQIDEAVVFFTRAETLYAKWKDQSDSSSCRVCFSLMKYPFSLTSTILEQDIPKNAYVWTAMFLLDFHLPYEAQCVLGMERARFAPDMLYAVCSARAKEHLREYRDAETTIQGSIVPADAHVFAWMLFGHLYYVSSSYQKAYEAYEKMFRFSGLKPLFNFAILEMAKSYMHDHQLEKAKQIFMELCSVNPTSSSWLGAGMVFYKQGDISNAEAALAEGNLLDPWNFKIWAYLVLICLKTNRMEEAMFAFNHALQCNLNSRLLIEIAETFYEKGNPSYADIALRRACDGNGDDIGSKVSWGSGPWNERVELAKRVVQYLENTISGDLPFEFDPLKAAILNESETQYNSETQIRELQTVSSM